MNSIEQLNEQIQNAQKKIIELQQKEAEEKAELEKKQTMFEPNIMVLQKWLDTSKEIEKKKNIKIKYEQLMQKRHQDYVEECNKYPGKHHPSYSGEPIDKKIRDEYNKYWGTDDSGKPNYIEDKVPSNFMNNFIKATHNMFLIQQKRIDELETKVKLLSVKEIE